jgi:hypothetical protein
VLTAIIAMAIAVPTASAQVRVLLSAVKNDSVTCKEVTIPGRAVVHKKGSDTLLALSDVWILDSWANIPGGRDSAKTDKNGDFIIHRRGKEGEKGGEQLLFLSDPWAHIYPVNSIDNKYDKSVVKLDDKCVAQKLTLALLLDPKLPQDVELMKNLSTIDEGIIIWR